MTSAESREFLPMRNNNINTMHQYLVPVNALTYYVLFGQETPWILTASLLRTDLSEEEEITIQVDLFVLS